MNPLRLILILPAFNEEAVLPETTRRLTELMQRLIQDGLVSDSSRILYVNDGSRDRTWDLITDFHANNPLVSGISLAGNVGHQNALMAGMETAKGLGDIFITLDADLQDDIRVIPEMILKYREGNDIVCGVRRERTTDGWFKRTSAKLFYKLMAAWGINCVYNHADFRLMSKRAVIELCRYRERNLFLRGIVPHTGYPTSCVYYDRGERTAGKSKYSFRKMAGLAIDGITSFSIKPVRALSFMGIAFLLIALSILIYVLCLKIAEKTVAGWSSLMLSIWFVGGCILLGLGTLGEYIGKIYLEVKDRPRYHIEQTLLD